MYNIIPLIFILISLGIIVVIMARKFPVLANLDTNSIPAEREARFKEKIISNRLKRNFFKYFNRLSKNSRAIGLFAGNILKQVRQKLVDFKENYNREEIKAENEDSEQIVSQLFAEAEELVKAGDGGKAEKKYIKIIGLDSKNIKAFRKLGQLYFSLNNLSEAEQTFEHALKLAEQKMANHNMGDESGNNRLNDVKVQLAGIYFNLSLVERAADNKEKAVLSIKKALALEPNNPRYLDTGLEICIIKEDKAWALDIYKKLKEVNPDNKKLLEFKKQIDEL